MVGMEGFMPGAVAVQVQTGVVLVELVEGVYRKILRGLYNITVVAVAEVGIMGLYIHPALVDLVVVEMEGGRVPVTGARAHRIRGVAVVALGIMRDFIRDPYPVVLGVLE
jgi:hypothetical protein